MNMKVNNQASNKVFTNNELQKFYEALMVSNGGQDKSTLNHLLSEEELKKLNGLFEKYGREEYVSALCYLAKKERVNYYTVTLSTENSGALDLVFPLSEELYNKISYWKQNDPDEVLMDEFYDENVGKEWDALLYYHSLHCGYIYGCADADLEHVYHSYAFKVFCFNEKGKSHYCIDMGVQLTDDEYVCLLALAINDRRLNIHSLGKHMPELAQKIEKNINGRLGWPTHAISFTELHNDVESMVGPNDGADEFTVFY